MTDHSRKRTMYRNSTLAPMALAATLALALTACGGPPDGTGPGLADRDTAAGSRDTSGNRDTAESGRETGPGHGAVEGAQEVAEPQGHLVSVDSGGAVGMVSLLEETGSELGRLAPPTSVTSDGRYLFATTDAGVEIVDSGVWTWDHADHFHYYRTSPRLLGSVAGDGPAVVATSGNATTGGTGVLFSGSGRAVLLSNASLSRGEIDEVFRIPVEPHDGVVAPLGDGALVTVPDGSGTAAVVRFHDAGGAPVDEVTAPCPEARGTITTRIGVVVGCADGAVLATVGDTLNHNTDDDDGNDEDDDGNGQPTLEHIPYPEGAEAPAATEFRNRKGRPAVAAPAGDAGFWLLNTREREWRFTPTEQPLLQVAAAGDEAQHVVALDRAGRILVYRGDDGTEIAATEPLLAGRSPAGGDATGPVRPGVARSGVARPGVARPGSGDGRLSAEIELTVDRERAYLNDPAAGLVHEIDYRGGARVARSLATPISPDFYAEVGR